MASAFGLELSDLPAGWRPVEVVAVVKCIELDADGGTRHSIRGTPTLGNVEALGMLEAAAAEVARDVADGWEGEPE